MNSVVFNSELLDHRFSLQKIGISYAGSVKELGRFRLSKFAVFARTFFSLWAAMVFNRPAFIYFQPSITGATYLRDLVLILSGRLMGQRFILHFHGKGIRQAAERSSIMRFFYRLGISGQHAIVLSQKQKDDIHFLRPRSMAVLPNGIAPMPVQATEHHQRYPIFSFLFLSNLLRSKGVFDLLDAAVELRDKGYRFRVDLVGNEGDIHRAELEQAIDQRKLREIVFYHGPAYGAEKSAFFAKADAFVFPTQNDAFGLVLVEAMQFALPVVATNEGAIPEIVDHGRSGFLYDKHSPDLAHNMARLISDPAMAQAMGRAGAAIQAEKFTLAAFESGLATIFENLLHNKTT